MTIRLRSVAAATAALVLGLAALAPHADAAPIPTEPILDGKARFEVITPSLIRLEFAADGKFEDRPSQTTAGRIASTADFTTRLSADRRFRVIRTAKQTLRWRRHSGPFARGSLRVKVGTSKLRPRPGPNPRPLGGWRRSLDLIDGPVALHEGMLSRAGWYLLDDSQTALIRGNSFLARPPHQGSYQDLYLFAYGDHYVRGLHDLRTLTGAAPLLPRKAFGVWFSRWWPFGESDWHQMVDRFRSERVPLDTISLDTDFKRINNAAGAAAAATAVGADGLPYSWNGWDWNRDLFPDPARFLRFAKRSGLEVGLNVHPSIDSNDPRFAATQARAGGGLTASDDCRVVQADPSGNCMVFDWTDPAQLDAYFDLHRTFEDDGDVFWWLDWCCDGTTANAPGLTPDTWINRQYALHQRARNSRWPAFSRIGGSYQAGFDAAVGTGAFAEHHYTIQFTGDTCGSWPLIGFAAQYSAAAASIGLPYVSHDIGSFHAVSPNGICDRTQSPLLTPRFNSLPPEMYVRWVQLGTFQPLLRLHSHHGKRLPWDYPGAPGQIAARFLRLRDTLVPYLYTLARKAHDSGVPIVRPLYLQWPDRRAAYRNRSEYTLGKNLLVAPVDQPGDPVAKQVWFPPGKWNDLFTGQRFKGPSSATISVPLDRIPVFIRSGAVIPTQPKLPTTPVGSPRSIVLIAQRGDGQGTLYDDSGRGFGYRRGHFGRTRIHQTRANKISTLRISRRHGSFGGAPARRSYEIRLRGVDRPDYVEVDGIRTADFNYHARSRTAIVPTGARSTRRPLTIVVG